ncbi:hypothetical protein [Streptomyces levis]|uniref:hypothetical protein n=1 Tax=Streptomyces levis TaxID=285566 RepID=UPI003C7C6E27
MRRDLEATAPQPAPPAPTSGAAPAPRLLHPLDATLVQDLNVLADPLTGALPAPIRRIIRAAADARRASMRATARRLMADDSAPATGRAPTRA